MLVAAVLSLVGLAAVLFAWYRDTPRAPAAGPQLDLLPSPSDLRRFDFPLTVAGYHPAHVELHLEALVAAYSDLYEAAPDDVRAQARQRAARRRGVDLTEVDDPGPAPLPLQSAMSGPDVDALRTEAALADLERPARRGSGRRPPPVA